MEALHARNIEVLGIVFNTLDRQQDEAVLRDNPNIVKTFARVPILGRLPWSKDSKRLYSSFEPIAKKILTGLARTQPNEPVDRKRS